MRKVAFVILALGLVAGCGGDEEAGGLTAKERQRLENIADRLDKEAPFLEPTEAEPANAVEDGLPGNAVEQPPLR